jgi:hypothetical protein
MSEVTQIPSAIKAGDPRAAAELTTLQAFGTFILDYGELIPNPPRRSLRMVAVLSAVPFAVIPRRSPSTRSCRRGTSSR